MEVYSKERMTEPYMQLIVDLTWPKGQIFKVYTVLLDPPGYKLTNTIAQSGLTYQRKFTNYHQKTAAATAEVVPSGQKKKQFMDLQHLMKVYGKLHNDIKLLRQFYRKLYLQLWEPILMHLLMEI